MDGFENLRKQLALAVRYYQWSYAIFWSISITQPRVLEWGSGYYNGDIKTRKTTQSEELNADLTNSQRSDQLRDLYESLAAGDSNSQVRRPSAALSPEDLTDAEWYYLVCMSFVFNIGQGLPGKTYELGQPIWLSNAHVAENKSFSRSLLAKSADIQTVACFPFFGGVVELGVTELVPENMNLIEKIKALFLDILPQPIVPDISLRNGILINDDMDFAGIELNHEYADAILDPIEEFEELDSLSLDNSMNKISPDQVDDSFMITRGTSQVQSWHYLDEDFSNCMHNSFNSSDCISQTFAKAKKPTLKMENISDCYTPCPIECGRLQSLDARSDDLHYQSVISTLLKTSDQLGLGPRIGCCKKGLSFGKWNRVEQKGSSRPRDAAMSQVMLKKALFEVGKMHQRYAVPKNDPDETDSDPVPREQDMLYEKFVALKSLVPAIDKVDNVMLLDATISYLKELEQKVQTLESSKESTDLHGTSMPKEPQDTVQQTSDSSYKTNTSSNKNYPSGNKRKASHMDLSDALAISKTIKDSSTENIYISVVDNNVMIEMRCGWRECLLLKVMDVMSSLSLDSHSVQSSTVNGMLQLTIKSKFKGSRAPSVGVIRQKLHRMIVQSA